VIFRLDGRIRFLLQFRIAGRRFATLTTDILIFSDPLGNDSVLFQPTGPALELGVVASFFVLTGRGIVATSPFGVAIVRSGIFVTVVRVL
jgi:hypothetical protein